MKDVIQLVEEHLLSFDGTQKTETGFHQAMADEAIVTELIFRTEAGSSAPVTVATIESRFTPDLTPDFSAERIARLNRRSVHGAFFLMDGQLGCRLAFPLREQEQDAGWIAEYLVTAFRLQGLLGFVTARAEVSKAEFLAARDDLDPPRQWATPLADTAFEGVARRLEEEGQVARAHPGWLYIPVALDGLGMLQGGDDAVINITTGIEHPLAGTGYLATLTLPPLPLWQPGDAWCAVLNELDREIPDFPPGLGAWALRGGGGGAEIVYGLFIPAEEGSATMLDRIARWMIWRAEWIRDTHWEPGTGLMPLNEAE
ncbi:hypothetical protein GXW71_18620 [Roseomonas hellenica]|uniref:Uncharacterized protein n=1 Tax=Plastoroseomonas hellenica TaxID=2687306 RepID=A0ABS5F1D9_9PROT|nr:hypothetical protein [Plastoroseomonas hellenica]MBR0666381.1 hypothetical protein [Plastoroseomonas hellenica]